jgi:hypothetical protein
MVSVILDNLADGASVDSILANYPTLTRAIFNGSNPFRHLFLNLAPKLLQDLVFELCF